MMNVRNMVNNRAKASPFQRDLSYSSGIFIWLYIAKAESSVPHEKI
jgi:hypothetical protein